MRGLYISIILTVLGSLFFIGWGLDELVAYATEDKITETQTTTVYRQLVNGLTSELSSLSSLELNERVKQFQQHYQLDTSLASSKKIALPSSLIAQLTLPGGLLLASSANQYLLKSIANHPEFLLRLELPTETADDDNINFILTLTLYLSICFILILWLIPLTRRLYLLNNAAAKIGSGQLDVRIASSRLSYIKVLEQSFNTMASKLEKLVADNKILARSLSHDIRTPMACLRFGIEAALDSNSIEKKNNYLSRMDNELTRMEEMTSAFLDYASMERQGLNLKKQPTNICALITSAINDCQVLAEQKNISVQLTGDNTILYPLDYHWSYRALVNLISNAIGYANSQVLLTLTNNNQQLTITVEDDGKGIANDKLAIIFTPFVKLDADRSREQGHFGLGLAICSKIMDWHQGSINASNSQRLSGACFTLQFPK
ncbi:MULTISPECIES: sensor histidine kinase [Colwellia]|uniref:histidine kinase n=1 Tax=Colwellia marinimaniae TaxID=1513592 RepID=A0ABQ0MTY5_9GAMM|nr:MULTISPECIES: ATP-binding protein [Colwellia]GAW95834.1 two-component sensor histidine kinase [Colwellia marinimaniae]